MAKTFKCFRMFGMPGMFRRGLVLIVAALVLTSALAGCGAASNSTSSSEQMMVAPAVAPAADYGQSEVARDSDTADGSGATSDYKGAQNGATMTASNTVSGAEEAPAAASGQTDADSLAGSGSTSDDVSNAILAERKIIRSANLTIEVDNFDKAYNDINSIILGIGIVQESNITSDKVYVKDETKLVKRGTIVLRVDKDKFDSVINSLKGIGDVYNQQINGQDVTDKYVDIESRLRLLRLEQSHLESYLDKLQDLDQILKTESRLTEIRQEIESLTGNLKKMSSLVELSTITVTMNEQYPGSDNPPKPVTYGEKLLNNLKSSLEGVVSFLGELLIILVAAIPILIVLGLFVLLGIFLYRRIPKKGKPGSGTADRRETDKAPEKEQEKEQEKAP